MGPTTYTGVGCILGTLLALAGSVLDAHLRRNPWRIPHAVWFGRHALSGVLYFLATWSAASLSLASIVSGGARLLDPAPGSESQVILGMIVAVGLPHVFKAAKDRWVGKLPSSLGHIAQRTDHLTTLFFADLISEAAGAVSASLFRSPLAAGIDRAFEECLDEIARKKATDLPSGERSRVRFLARVRNRMTKLRYLLDVIGYERCRELLVLACREREILLGRQPPGDIQVCFPNWQPAEPDERRDTRDRRARSLRVPTDLRRASSGRRRTDDPLFWRAIGV